MQDGRNAKHRQHGPKFDHVGRRPHQPGSTGQGERGPRADSKPWPAALPAAWEENRSYLPPSEHPLKWPCANDCGCSVWKGEGWPLGH
jgi:hypothetical protein